MTDSIQILFEDDALLVAVKPPLVNSEHTEEGTGLPDLLQKEGHGAYIAPIHRLDLPVGGALLCAKTKAAAAALSRAAAEGTIKKEYAAIVHGNPAQEGRLEDLLFYDRRQGKSFVVERPRAGVKEAALTWRLLAVRESEYGPLSCLSVFPETGRTHQIRVQFSHAGYPLLGDRKYGAPENAPLGLACRGLAFPHPVSGERVSVCFTPTDGAWRLFFPE